MFVMLCIALLVLILNVPSLLDEKDKNILYVECDKSDEVEKENPRKEDNAVDDKATKEADDILNDIYNK